METIEVFGGFMRLRGFHTATKQTYPLRLVWRRVGQDFLYNWLNRNEDFQQ